MSEQIRCSPTIRRPRPEEEVAAPPHPQGLHGAALIVECSRDSAIAQAEWEVIEAAVAYRRLELEGRHSLLRDYDLGLKYFNAGVSLAKTTDRLLSLRQEAENRT